MSNPDTSLLRPDNPSIRALRPSELVSYLTSQGWKLDDGEKAHFLTTVFDDDLLEIVLPKKTTAPDYSLYVADAINMLAAMRDVSPKEILAEIATSDRDIITIKVDDSEHVEGINLNVASQQINGIKNLITFSACSEKKPLPTFPSGNSAKAIVARYQFGHTIAASFSYKIYVTVSEVQNRQLELPSLNATIPNYPIERRITERIVRGIQLVNQAQQSRDIAPIVENYTTGLNANMCRALIDIIGERSTSEAVEFGWTWASSAYLPEDLQGVRTLKLRSSSVPLLEDAETELKKTKPDYVEVRGMVTWLNSNTPPSATEGEAIVIIRWDRGFGPSIEVQVRLSKKDYARALEAHTKWETVQVTGILERRSTGYKLGDPRGFTVLKPRI